MISSRLSVRYAIVFALFAGGLVWVAITNGGAALILLWPGLSFLMVAVAYSGIGVAVFGKKPDGSRTAWAIIYLLPYLIFSWLLWAVRRLISREACCNEIAPGLWLGRRPYRSELPQGTTCVVDLACEFNAAKGLTAQVDYISLPTLDTLPPPFSDLTAMLERVSAHPGTIYVHCALGHGRSAMFAAAILLTRGLAQTPAEALRIIQNVRPSVRLSCPQQNALGQFAATSSKC